MLPILSCAPATLPRDRGYALSHGSRAGKELRIKFDKVRIGRKEFEAARYFDSYANYFSIGFDDEAVVRHGLAPNNEYYFC